MKKFILYSLSAFTLLLGSGCSDTLNTDPTTSVASDQVMKDSKSAMMALNGIYRAMYTTGWSVTGNTAQATSWNNFNIMGEVMGEDFIMAKMGNGWFWYDCTYDLKDMYDRTTWRSWDVWNTSYALITNANSIIQSKETMAGTEADKNQVVGGAYAMRAFYYYFLVQKFARTYVGHENEPGVPIYTTATTKQTVGQPRSSVDSVYTLIYNDINEAIRLLKDATPRDLSNKSQKTYVDYAVANGLKARIALTMNKWSDAKAAAAIARADFSIGGETQILKGMNAASNTNVIWGAFIKSDQSAMYGSFCSHVAEDGPYGIAAPKIVNKELYESMGAKDIRRSWWNPDAETPYQQVKFKFSNRATWEADDIWMRAEEMLLIEAEAACRLEDWTTAQNLLKEIMKERDSEYTISKTGNELKVLTHETSGSLLEEIVKQRRIELWGEGFRIFDINRLKQGFTRTTAMGWPSSALIQGRNTQSPESYAWVLTIPQKEFDTNKSLDPIKDQNPLGDQ